MSDILVFGNYSCKCNSTQSATELAISGINVLRALYEFATVNINGLLSNQMVEENSVKRQYSALFKDAPLFKACSYFLNYPNQNQSGRDIMKCHISSMIVRWGIHNMQARAACSRALEGGGVAGRAAVRVPVKLSTATPRLSFPPSTIVCHSQYKTFFYEFRQKVL